MNILLTGAAGFVGWKTAELLCADGHTVVGIDNLNDYYEVSLKQWRLQQLDTTAPPLHALRASHHPTIGSLHIDLHTQRGQLHLLHRPAFC